MKKEENLLQRPERRNNRRLDISLEVGLEIDGQLVQATTSNISCGGLFLPIQQAQLKSDQDVKLTLNLPDTKKPVRLLGSVTWLESSPQSSNRGVAIKFKGLYDDNILAIDRFIKNKLH